MRVAFSSGTKSLSVDEGVGNVTLKVQLTVAAVTNVTVTYAAVNGTAKSGSDFRLAPGNLTFAPGEKSKVGGGAQREGDRVGMRAGAQPWKRDVQGSGSFGPAVLWPRSRLLVQPPLYAYRDHPSTRFANTLWLQPLSSAAPTH